MAAARLAVVILDEFDGRLIFETASRHLRDYQRNLVIKRSTGQSYSVHHYFGAGGFAAYFLCTRFRQAIFCCHFLAPPVPRWHFALDYKIALVLAQVLGYAVSKMIGVKLIAENNAG